MTKVPTHAGSAVFDRSPPVYRYRLRRHLGTQPDLLAPHKCVLFVMLNPSTAGGGDDDATIRRCLGFAHREGASELDVVNLYALRATDPKALLAHPDPVGPDNDFYIRKSARDADLIIAAWGGFEVPGRRERIAAVMNLIKPTGKTVMALGVTLAGAPAHPLYLPADVHLIPWLESPSPDPPVHLEVEQ